MESTLRKNRGTRNTYSNYGRRKKENTNYINRATQIIKQLIVCAAIFMVGLTIKNIDSSFTKNISTSAQTILKTDTKLNSVVSNLKGYFIKLSFVNEKIKSVFNSEVDAESQNEDASNIPADMKDKIYDYNLIKAKKLAIPTVGTLSSGFGSRVNTITNTDEFHQGIDIGASEGDNIYSVLDGEVIDTGADAGYGNFIKINHGEDLKTLYAHVSLIEVEKGEMVKKGEVIGKVGSTGLSNGPHLHLEIWKGDQMVNPQKIFDFSNKEVVYN